MPVCWDEGGGHEGGGHEEIAVCKSIAIQKGRDTGIIYNVEKPPRRDMVDLPDSW